MSSRREARERALSLCYELDVRGESVDELLADLPAPPDAYALVLVRGVDDHREDVDAVLRKYSEHWALERMPVVDRPCSGSAATSSAGSPSCRPGS